MTSITAPRKARERARPPMLAPLAPEPPAPAPQAPKRRAVRKPAAACALPAHREAPGALSYRASMPDHERAVIDAALTILGRHLREPGAAFDSPEAVKHYLCLHLGAERRELFAVLYLDSQHRAIAFETLFTGTLTQTSVYPREVVLSALAHDAAAVVLAHNHPSGNASPSRADEAMTQTLEQALALVDVRVLDHIIIGGNQALSMVERGLMS